MDPLSMIVSAVVMGIAAAAKPVAAQAVKDAYSGLRALIVRKFGQPVSQAIEQVEQKPESEGHQMVLKEELEAAKADQDQELVEQAQKLLQLVQPQQVGMGKYNVQMGQAQGVTIGDGSQVTQYFGEQPKKEQ